LRLLSNKKEDIYNNSTEMVIMTDFFLDLGQMRKS